IRNDALVEVPFGLLVRLIGIADARREAAQLDGWPKDRARHRKGWRKREELQERRMFVQQVPDEDSPERAAALGLRAVIASHRFIQRRAQPLDLFRRQQP